MIERSRVKYNIVVFLVTVYFFSFLISKIIGNNAGLMINVCLSFVIALSFCYESKSFKFNKIYLLALFFIISISLFYVYIGNYKYSRLIYSVSMFISSCIVAIFISKSSYLMRRIIIVLQCLFLLFCFFVLFLSFINGVEFYTYIESFSVGFSYNYISGYLILLFSLYCAFFARNENRIPYGRLQSIIVFLLCVLLYGRSGILLSGLLLVTVFFYNAKAVERIFYSLVFSVLILVVFVFHEIFYDLISQTKFSEGVSSPRFGMLQEYFSLLNLKTLLFGVDLFDMKTIAPYDYNPHNSFLYFHATFGIFGFVLFFFMFMKVITVNNWGFTVFLLFFCFRGFFDVIIFPGILDFLFFSLILMTPFGFKVHNRLKG